MLVKLFTKLGMDKQTVHIKKTKVTNIKMNASDSLILVLLLSTKAPSQSERWEMQIDIAQY